MSTRNISLNIIWPLLLFLFLDIYVYMGLKKSIDQHRFKPFLNILYMLSVVLGYIGFYYLYFYFSSKPLQVELLPNLAIGFFFSFLAFKMVMTLFFLFEDLLRIIKIGYTFVLHLISPKNTPLAKPGRRSFIRNAGLIIAGIPFTSMLYGITKGKYNFKVNTVRLTLKNLPKAFEGFKIVHISDIHSGSFDDKEAILEGVRLINEQRADLILFTGDLVNNDSREVEPYMANFKQLEAEYGVYSVLGNHDYGDYKKWKSAEDKERNMQLLYEFQEKMGFKLLNNEHAILRKNNESIGIFGVENWGNPPFPQRGDLDKALAGSTEGDFKILMSHDPTHWSKKVIDHPTHIDLTLSGHTHGMQFGVEIPGFKWSPIKYVYPQWAGLYETKKQLLYVNRGFGFLGFPGRVGIWPEITLLELTQNG